TADPRRSRGRATGGTRRIACRGSPTTSAWRARDQWSSPPSGRSGRSRDASDQALRVERLPRAGFVQPVAFVRPLLFRRLVLPLVVARERVVLRDLGLLPEVGRPRVLARPRLRAAVGAHGR